MVSIPKIVGVLSCGFLLCLGMSNAASASDDMKASQSEMKADQTDRRQGGQEVGEKQMSDDMKGGLSKGGNMIAGEVLRVEGDHYFVKGQDGKEIRLHTDHTTQKSGDINQGDRVEATVNDQNHALSIRSAPTTDRRNEADRPGNPTVESGQTHSKGQ